MSIGRARSGGIVTTSNASLSQQIGAKRACARERRQIDVCRADYARVDLECTASAYPFDLSVLDGSEHLFLDRVRGARDFVEEERSAVRTFEPPHVLSLRAGECSRFVAEQLGVRAGCR